MSERRLALVSDQPDTLNDQVSKMVAENQHLRVKSDGDDKIIHLLKEQYEQLQASVGGMRDRYQHELHEMRVERDKATVAYQEINALLLQATSLITKALHARVTEDPKLEDQSRYRNDERLPGTSL